MAYKYLFILVIYNEYYNLKTLKKCFKQEEGEIKMKLTRKFEVDTNGNKQTYLVTFIRGCRWPEVVIYKHNPTSLFIRKRRMHSELECIVNFTASTKHGIDMTATDAMEQVAKAFLNDYIEESQKTAAAAKVVAAQERHYCS